MVLTRTLIFLIIVYCHNYLHDHSLTAQNMKFGNFVFTKGYSRSQNSPPQGNGVHFMFADVSRPVFSEESEGADHFLKKGAQHAHFGPFLVHSWAKLKRLCCLT